MKPSLQIVQHEPAPMFEPAQRSREELWAEVAAFDQAALQQLYDALAKAARIAAVVGRCSTLPIGVLGHAQRLPETLGALVSSMQLLETRK